MLCLAYGYDCNAGCPQSTLKLNFNKLQSYSPNYTFTINLRLTYFSTEFIKDGKWLPVRELKVGKGGTFRYRIPTSKGLFQPNKAVNHSRYTEKYLFTNNLRFAQKHYRWHMRCELGLPQRRTTEGDTQSDGAVEVRPRTVRLQLRYVYDIPFVVL